MKGRLAAACRLFFIYGIPFAVIVIVDKLPNAQGYTGPVILGSIVWMFTFHFLINGNARRDGEN